MEKIRYSGEFICPKCGRHTALVFRADGTHQAHCMICDAYYDIEIAKTTNADKLRSMSDEELAEYHAEKCGCPHDPIVFGCRMATIGCIGCWLDWLREEAGHE